MWPIKMRFSMGFRSISLWARQLLKILLRGEYHLNFPQLFLHRSMAVNWSLSYRVIVQCTYPLAGLHRLFSVYRFESDTVGVGRIIHTTQSTAGTVGCSPAGHDQLSLTILDFWAFSCFCTVGSQIPTIQPTTAPQTTPATTSPIRMPIAYLAAIHPPARYIKVSRIQNLHGLRKGENLPLEWILKVKVLLC